jgi:hypothetical protein
MGITCSLFRVEGFGSIIWVPDPSVPLAVPPVQAVLPTAVAPLVASVVEVTPPTFSEPAAVVAALTPLPLGVERLVADRHDEFREDDALHTLLEFLADHTVDATNWRYYAVWHIPGRAASVTGIYYGNHPQVWACISALCPNGRYAFPVKLRRFPDLRAAFEGYRTEAARHSAPLPPHQHYYP